MRFYRACRRDVHGARSLYVGVPTGRSTPVIFLECNFDKSTSHVSAARNRNLVLIINADIRSCREVTLRFEM